MAGHLKHNWKAFRIEFASGAMSIRQFAEMHKLSPTQTQSRATKDDWAGARREFHAKIAVRAEHKAVEFQATSISRINRDTHEIASSVIGHCKRLLKIEKDGEGNITSPKIPAPVLKQVIEAAAMAHRLRLESGEHPGPVQRLEVSGPGGKPVQVAALKLALMTRVKSLRGID